MRKYLLLFIVLIISANTYSQITFEKGYYIDNSDKRAKCLIKNIDWKNNPIEFEYRHTTEGVSQTANIDSVKEFGIYNFSKYIRCKVKIDRSSELVDELSESRLPEFQEEIIFLKVLLEGSANLYSYEDINLVKYFYSVDSSEIEQLVFKTYMSSNHNFAENTYFKQQIWNSLKCNNLSEASVKNIRYSKKDLVKVFTKYNLCKDSNYLLNEDKKEQDFFNLNIRLGVNNSSLQLQNEVASSLDIDYGRKFGFRFGIETEFIFPFNKNKWALVIDPNYQYFKVSKELATVVNADIDYKSIELPIGIRYYIFLKQNSKIFADCSYVIDFSLNSTARKLDIQSGQNFALGIGYNYNNKYSVQFKYQTRRELLTNYVSWSADYNTMSLIFAYTIL